MNFEESADVKLIRCKSCSSDNGFRFDIEALIYSIKHPFYICRQCIQNILNNNTDEILDDKAVVNRNIKIEK
ncbi:hypothetical protein MCHI_000987 [Candidatus Magnetoovum chiemensis]|nr:hypothetical protein MCHI_000987 [Candidatus Magnetoovum chiemensis]